MDIRLLDYAEFIRDRAKLKKRRHLTPSLQAELGRLNDAVLVWETLAERVTGSPKDSDTEFWQFARKINYAGVRAVQIMSDAPEAGVILTEPEQKSKKQPRAVDTDEVRTKALANPRWAMAKFQVVETVETSKFGRVYKSFTMNKYQELSYGPFVDDYAAGNNPPRSPFYEVRGKPRQVGSTEFWKQFISYAMQWYPGTKCLLHTHKAGVSSRHLRSIRRQFERMADEWPELFWPMTKRTDNEIELANGSSIIIGSAEAPMADLSFNFNIVVLSEVGKYERISANRWSDINQTIIPSVHAGPHNVVAWEGTNDENARELQRLSREAEDEASAYRFLFFGFTVVDTYVGPPVYEPSSDPSDRWSDYEFDEDGNRVPISEEEYAERHKLNPGQVGFRRQKIRSLGDIDLVHREYPVTWEESCTSSKAAFFGASVLKKKYSDCLFRLSLRNAGDKRVVLVKSESDHGLWSVWHTPSDCEEYALAGDFSDGIPGGDYTVLLVHRLSDGEQVAAARFRANEKVIAEQMVLICKYYGDKPYVMGELNNVGKAVRSAWLEYSYGRNYHRILDRKSYDTFSDSMWFLQTSASREPLILRFKTALCDNLIGLNDVRFSWDAQDFIKSDVGRYEAAHGISSVTGESIRDDYVMAAALAWEMLRSHPLRARMHNIKPDKSDSKRMKISLVDEAENYSQLFGRVFNG